MMQFYIGQSQQYIAVQYAKSARSSCRECKQKIGKDQLRIGLLLDDDHFMASYWYHPDCFHFKPRHKVLDVQTLEQMIYGIQHLEPKDSDQIIDQLKEQLRNFKDDKFKKANKKSKLSLDQKNKDKSKIKSQLKQQLKQQKKGKKTKSRGKSSSVEPQPQPKKQKKSVSKNKKNQPKQKKAAKSIKFLSAAQTKQYNEYIKDYLTLTAVELKQILGKNFQPKTGTKDELAARCADGKQFGRIPSCNSCGGGKLRFNRTNGTYKCPGYMQDTDFKNCGATYKFDEIKRQQWKE